MSIGLRWEMGIGQCNASSWKMGWYALELQKSDFGLYNKLWKTNGLHYNLYIFKFLWKMSHEHTQKKICGL